MKISLPVVVAGVVASFAGVGTCVASTSITYQVSGEDPQSEVVKATATFVLTGNSLVLTLTNTDSVASINSVGQAVTGIKFNLGTAGGTEAVGGTGNLADVGSGGGVTEDTTGVTSDSLVGWTATTTLPTVNLNIFGGGGPDESILPSTGSGNVTGTSYPNAGGSIAGNGPHNPFVDGSATFTFTALSGLTSSNIASILSAVQIGFGTGNNDYLTGSQVVTPEPGTIGLCLGGLGLLLASRRRRRA